MTTTDPANTTSGAAVAAPVDRHVRPLVERLRVIAQWDTPGAEEPPYKPNKQQTCNEAAAELERLGAMLGGLDSHGRYWIENRGRIIDAVAEAGFQIASNRARCWLHGAEQRYTEQQVADACMMAEIPDSKCESLLIALKA